jgi:hypothetical protein
LQWLDLQSDYWDMSEQLAFITVFIVVFFGLVGIATTARVHEVITTTASHAALLVVFMQLNSSCLYIVQTYRNILISSAA